MQPPESPIRFWYQKPQLWIALGVLVCAGFLTMPHVRRVYHRWTGEKKVQRANEALARGDYETVMINAKGALATNAQDLEALRVMAKMAEAMGSPQALDYRRQIEAINPTDVENLLGIAEAHLKTVSINAAEQALRNVPAADRTTARYHDVAAAIAWARKDGATAEAHAAEASRLAPTDDGYQLKLATMQLSAKSGEIREGAIQSLRAMSSKPPMRSSALRALIWDAESRGEWDRAIELANELASAADASFADRIAMLSTLNSRREAVGRATGVRGIEESIVWTELNKLRSAAGNNAEHLSQLLAWMNEHHQALMVLEWADTLPVEMVSKRPVCIAIADACVRSSYWNKLKVNLEKSTWEGKEFLRDAYLSRALEGEGDLGGSATAWNRAMEKAQSQPAALETLARETIKWGWKRQSEEVLWKMTTLGRYPRWAVDALWELGLKRQNPKSLYKASKLVLQAEPKSVVARNHFISLALITEQESDSPHTLAETHYRERPENIAVASTYGFSLFQQGRAEEAVAVMATFSPEQLRAPALAFYHGMFLAGAGRPEEAEEYFRLGERAPVFPELIAIRNFLRTLFEARLAERNGEPQESEQAWQNALLAAQTRTQWLEMLGRIALKWGWNERTGEVAQRLADSGRCPAWAVEPLWTASLRAGDAAQLYKASKVILDANPKSLSARSNFITVALQAGKEGDAPHRLAETLSREHSNDPEATTTYAYSLHCQGDSEKGLALLRSLKPEQLREPRPTLYHAILLAAIGEADKAEESLKIGTTGPLLPGEKVIAEILSAAFRWHSIDKGGDRLAAETAWKETLSVAERRPQMLPTLGRMLQKWSASEKATEVFWKLADAPDCPRWVLDHLWTEAKQRRDSIQLYKVSRLLRRADPSSVAIRNDHVRLGLLTGQDTDFPHRQADSLFDENPGNAEVAATRALSLYQRSKVRDAAVLLAGLKPEQLRIPRVAYYYGIVLLAEGQSAQAQDYLRIGQKELLLPEEENLLSKVTSASGEGKAH